MAPRLHYPLFALLFLLPLALSRHDDDFAFDNGDEVQMELTANHSNKTKNGLRRLWGVPDTLAYVGHLFRMEIPKEAFSGEVVAYKVRSENGKHTPSWLAVDTRHGLISGVPLSQDRGTHSFIVTAHGPTAGITASDTFTIEVKKAEEKSHSKYGSCGPNQNKLKLLIIVDMPFHQITPRQRIRALMELSRFMALDGDEFGIESYKTDSKDHIVVMAGPGTVHRRRGDGATAINLNVGCGDRLWVRHKVLVAGLREQARDGTLTHLLRLPVLGWRLIGIKPTPRLKRQLATTEGSGAYYDEEDEADYSGYDDDEDVDYETSDNVPEVGPNRLHVTDTETDHKVNIVPMGSSPTTLTHSPLPTNPRRYGHSPVIIVPDTDIPTTTEPDSQTVIIRASSEAAPVSMPIPPMRPATSTVSSTMSTQSTSTTTEATVPTPPPPLPTFSEIPITLTTPSTVPSTVHSEVPTTTPMPETTLPEITRQETIPITDKSTTIIGRTTETVTFGMPSNQPPVLHHHVKKLAVTAGKAFRYIIPQDLFTDMEDGTNLTFSMYDIDNLPLKPTSWVQFLPNQREVYGLPLETHVSRWNFVVEACDSEGAAARDPLDITVQQHKGRRTVNHKFAIKLKLNRPYEHAIDWQIRALEGLVNLFRDTDMDNMTVLNVTMVDDLYEFVWTNDTLPKETCPTEDINRLMKILESDSEPGSPSPSLSRAMSPDLKVVGVSWRGMGSCLDAGAGTPSPPVVPPAQNTYPPVPRNQVDQVRATAGHLLVYRVPEDTFFDPEDGGTRNLRLTLVCGDRTPLPSGHWMQFDSKNQEFYGLPTDRDIGKKEYQLIAEDSSGKTAYDVLIVEVNPAPPIRPTVEFQMTLEYPYNDLAGSALVKRKYVEKLAALFGQRDADPIRIKSITDHPTTIVWYNTSLPMDRCPNQEIQELRNMIISDEHGSALKEIVDVIFDKDFKVMSIKLDPRGMCADQHTKVYKPNIDISRVHDTKTQNAKSAGADGYTEYLVTFVIPAIVVVCMLLVAGVIACVLYRRRRTGKMSVGDEEERQAFRSKGIPVIFQDELEERADAEPAHKSPIIMRDEKPPLLPPAPDYRSSSDDAPYRPPPPFAASRTPPRPKATPTYRKPPPYVPP